MYATYVFISVILLMIGVAGSVYFVRFLKNTNLLSTGIPALSESLNTIFIGAFYFYCAIAMSQHTLNPPTTESEIATIATIATDVVETTEFDMETTTTTTTSTSSQFPNEEYLLSYQHFLQNAIKRNVTYKTAKQLNINDNSTSSDCFGQIFMESSMFLYSFLHSVVSLIISAANQQPGNGEASGKSRQRNEEAPTSQDNVSCLKLKLVGKMAVIFVTPIMCVVALYFAMDQNMEIKLVTKLLDPSNIESNIWGIIYKPVNVSTAPEKISEINDVVQNVYSIINASRMNAMSTPPPVHEVYNLVTNRTPKLIVECPSFDTVHRIYTAIVFVAYFLVIMFAKVREVKMQARDESKARRLNVSIKSFALLWSLGILELFSKTYLFNNNHSNILSQILLSMGNFNQLSIILMEYLAAKDEVKKFNLVEPKA